MANYSKGAGKKVEEAMHEMKEGKLKSGRSGKKVTSRKQAIAIGLSEAREKGAKVPAKGSKSSGGRSREGKKAASKSSGRTASKGRKRASGGSKKSAPRKAATKSSGGRKSASKSASRKGAKKSSS